MADETQYEGLDEATLTEMMANASNYDERSAIRKAIRKQKGGGNKTKKTGSASYRRAGYQAPKSMAIPNSVTGNVLPNRVNMENIQKTEVPQAKATLSYLKAKTVTTRGAATGSAAVSSGRGSSTPPRGSTSSPRGSTSSVTPEPKISEAPREEAPEDSKLRSSQAVNVTEGRTPSPQPPAPRMTVDETPREPSPEPREPTPEPPREPTPEPEPEPPKEPTPEPEPPREPTPEPEPPKEKTPEPEPPREPTPEPEPPKEPTPEPEPPREPTPEPEPLKEPSPEPLKETDRVEVEEDEEEEEEDEGDEDEGEESDEDDEEEGAHRRSSYDKDDERVQYRQTKQVGDGPKAVGGLPSDVLAKQEEGIEGDFRKKLQKTSETKIDTRAAFPQARTKGEQLDFRNVLKKTKGPERKMFKTGGHAQLDFRGNLKKQTPEKAPKPSRRARDADAEDEIEQDQEEQEPQPEIQEEEQPEPEQQHDEEVEPEDRPEEPEEEEAPKEEEEVVQEEEVEVEKEEVEEAAPDETDSKPSESAQDEDSYEARQAERRRRREQRQKELEEVNDSTKPVQNGTKEESREKKEGSPSDPDSYEARREARRKAREERLKAASARVDEKPRLTYRERKALEAKKQMANAKQSREKWENREEETGAKDEAKPASFKKKDTATQQLLHWCQHKTKYYENVNIKDFRQSWSDGMAFCAILHSFMPDKIPYDDLTPDNPRKNFTIAFDAAIEAGIPQMLDVDDMVAVKIPDAKSIMTFLVTIYQHFNS